MYGSSEVSLQEAGEEPEARLLPRRCNAFVTFRFTRQSPYCLAAPARPTSRHRQIRLCAHATEVSRPRLRSIPETALAFTRA